ncbi:hypothetical protein ABGB18_45370 [Nonomuraea sp. B12E4]
MRRVPGLRTLGRDVPLPNGWHLNTGSVVLRVAGTTAYSVSGTC